MIGKDKAYKKETSCTLLLGVTLCEKCKLLTKLEDTFANANSFNNWIVSKDYLKNNIKYNLIYSSNIRFSKILVVSVHKKGEDINIFPVCSLEMDKFDRNVMISEMNQTEKNLANNSIYNSGLI